MRLLWMGFEAVQIHSKKIPRGQEKTGVVTCYIFWGASAWRCRLLKRLFWLVETITLIKPISQKVPFCQMYAWRLWNELPTWGADCGIHRILNEVGYYQDHLTLTPRIVRAFEFLPRAWDVLLVVFSVFSGKYGSRLASVLFFDFRYSSSDKSDTYLAMIAGDASFGAGG